LWVLPGIQERTRSDSLSLRDSRLKNPGLSWRRRHGDLSGHQSSLRRPSPSDCLIDGDECGRGRRLA
jgi:hypothetical protein